MVTVNMIKEYFSTTVFSHCVLHGSLLHSVLDNVNL